jgi:transglutaminase-like putative cysteine protease
MFYSIRHLTRFRYSAPVSESIMELRMHPRTEGSQRCLTFEVSVDPRARLYQYRDYLGNSVHHFNVPGKHTQLRIVAEALVEVVGMPDLPPSLDQSAWAELDSMVSAGDYWEMLLPSQYAQATPAFDELISEFGVERRTDPLTLVREIKQSMFDWFDYVPKSTRVDSPIDHAIKSRAGVCQDFAHIMSALLRHVKIPTRYVSGYLYHGADASTRSVDGATHAWVEALLPGIGWTGVDPTNDLFAGERHVRTAIGRDYADVPPTRGVFKGDASSELAVKVSVAPSDAPPPPENELTVVQDWAAIAASDAADALQEQQQQQQ